MLDQLIDLLRKQNELLIEILEVTATSTSCTDVEVIRSEAKVLMQNALKSGMRDRVQLKGMVTRTGKKSLTELDRDELNLIISELKNG